MLNRKERRASRRQEYRKAGPQGRAGGTANAIELAALHEAQGRPHEAVRLLKQVLTRDPQNAAVIGALGRFSRAYPRPQRLTELIGEGNAVADDARLLALLQSEVIREIEIELFLTAVRRELLAARTSEAPLALDENVFELACALAQQCFLNEYVFDLNETERAQAARLRDRVAQAGPESAPDDLAVLGCCVPLHEVPNPARLAARSWPKPLDAVFTLQVSEPLTELADAPSIPALTAIEDRTSQQVRQQYEENPYPRWVVPLPAPPTTVEAYSAERFGLAGAPGNDILIAGCGTGEQSINSAQTFPRSKVLAVDISRNSLAYARRKTREPRRPTFSRSARLAVGST